MRPNLMPTWAHLPTGDLRQPLAAPLALRLSAAQTRLDVAQIWAEVLQALIGWRGVRLDLAVSQTGSVQPLICMGDTDPDGRTASGRTAGTSIDLKMPLVSGTSVLRLRMKRELAYTSIERALVDDICDHCRTAMVRADAQERMAEGYRRLTSFGRLAVRLGEQTTRQEAGQQIADIANDLIGWDACFFDLYDAQAGTILEMINVDIINGVKTEVKGHHTSGPPGRLERRVLEEGGFILEQDVKAPIGDMLFFGDEARPSASMLFVPARYRGEVVAFLSIQSYTPHAYGVDDLALLQTLADHCAGALARLRLEEELLHAASYDHLTHLPNRAMFMDRLQQQFARLKREPHYRFAMLYLDLDRFKEVNDRLGHGAGDALLIEVGHRLSSQCRPTDTAARMGGDEFTVIIEDSKDAASLRTVARRIASALTEPLQLEGEAISPSASVGVALNGPSDTPDTLIRAADAALYRAKREGRGRVEFAPLS